MGLTVFLLGYVLDAFIICVYVTKMEDWERLWGGISGFVIGRPVMDVYLFLRETLEISFRWNERSHTHKKNKQNETKCWMRTIKKNGQKKKEEKEIGQQNEKGATENGRGSWHWFPWKPVPWRSYRVFFLVFTEFFTRSKPLRKKGTFQTRSNPPPKKKWPKSDSDVIRSGRIFFLKKDKNVGNSFHAIGDRR